MRYSVVIRNFEVVVAKSVHGNLNILPVFWVFTRVHSFFLFELFDLSLPLFSLELPLLSLFLRLSLLCIEGGLLGSLLLSSKGRSLVLFFLLLVVLSIIAIFGLVIKEVLFILGILANNLVLKHLLESLNIGLQELRHPLDSKCSHVSSILDGLDSELFELKNIVVLVLQLVEVDCVVLDTPGYLLFGLLDRIFVSFIEDLEELWVDLEVILSDLEML